MNKNFFVSEYGELSNEILLNVAELLALQLPEGTDRIVAAKWVKKFNICDPKAYQHYLSLFVSCLTKQLLVEPFDEAPKDSSNQWYNFGKNYTQQNINSAVIRRLYKDSFAPPYLLDMSSDLKEYVAYQEIPFFGAHFYYAFSPRDNIDKWSKFNKMKVPKNLVEILRKDELVESPIKGRLLPRPRSKQSEAANVSFRPSEKPKTLKASKVKKPEWEDLIPQEEPEQEPERKQPTIVIPTDGPIKNIPPALQRRMAKAEQERQERLAKKAQENKDRISQLAMPKKRLTASRPLTSTAQKKKPTVKKIKGVAVDDIDASLMSEKPAQIQVKPKSPEFKGPHADLQRRLFQLRQSNAPPSDLIKMTHNISQATADINTETERLKREKTANLQNVERLHNAGISVGNRVLNMLKEQQADEIKETAENAAGAIENIRLTMEELNDMLEQKATTHDIGTLRRLNEIKERMQQSAFEAQNISIRMNEKKLGHDLINVMGNMVDVNENSAYQLQSIQPETQQEGILIEGLENSSQQVAEAIQAQRDRLSRALDNFEPNLLPILEQTVKSVDEILSSSLNEDSQLIESVQESNNAQQIIEIETQKNEQLSNMNEQALKILNDVDAVMAKIMDMNISDDLIDIDNEDLGFSDILDDHEIERQRQFKIKERQERQERLAEILAKSQLVSVDDNENLEDVSSNLIDEIEKSIEEIDQILIPGLEKLDISARNQNDRDLIHEAITVLEQQSDVLNYSLNEMKNLRESVNPESGDHVDHDLIDFNDEEDLIKFD